MAVRPRPISSQELTARSVNDCAIVYKPFMTRAIAPEANILLKPEILSTAMMTAPTSVKAPPMAVTPRPIDAQSLAAIALNDVVRSHRPSMTIVMAPEANKLLKPEILSTAMMTAASSVKAPPMAVRPRPISSQDMTPSDLSAVEMSSSPVTTMRIEPAANKLENPAILPTTVSANDISPSAPPMAARPRPMDSQSMAPRAFKGSTMSCMALARMTVLTAVDMDALENDSSFMAPAISTIAPPMAVRPRAMLPQSMVPIECRAPASISIALAKAIVAIPVFMMPLVSNASTVLAIDFIDRFNIAIIAPIAAKPTAISGILKPAILRMALARRLMATAISRRVNALMDPVKAETDFLRVSRASLNILA